MGDTKFSSPSDPDSVATLIGKVRGLIGPGTRGEKDEDKNCDCKAPLAAAHAKAHSDTKALSEKHGAEVKELSDKNAKANEDVKTQQSRADAL